MDWNRIEGNWKQFKGRANVVQVTAIKTPELLAFGYNAI